MKGRILIFIAGSFFGAAVVGFVYKYTRELRVAYCWLKLEWQWIFIGVTAILIFGLLMRKKFKKKKTQTTA